MLGVLKRRSKEYMLFTSLFSILLSLVFTGASYAYRKLDREQSPLQNLINADLWVFNQGIDDPFHSPPIDLEKASILYQIREFALVSPVILERSHFLSNQGTSIEASIIGLGSKLAYTKKREGSSKAVTVDLFSKSSQMQDQASAKLFLNHAFSSYMQQSKKTKSSRKPLLILAPFDGACLMLGKEKKAPSAFTIQLKHPAEAKKLAQLTEKLTNLRVIQTKDLGQMASHRGEGDLFEYSRNATLLAALTLIVGISIALLEVFSQKIFATLSLIIRIGARPSQLILPMILHYSATFIPALILGSLGTWLVVHKIALDPVSIRVGLISWALSLGGTLLILTLHFTHSWNSLLKEER